MDTGEYETNALLINNISSVSFAFYEPVSPPPPSFGANALELENPLRKDGYLVHVDVVRRGLWCFRLSRKDGTPEGQPGPSNFPKSLERCGYALSLVEEGAFEPFGLAKNRLFGPSASNTPSSSSSSAPIDVTSRSAQSATLATPQSLPIPGTEQDYKGSASAEARTSSSSMPIKDAYEALVSAVASAISSHFCAKTGALPLNARTFLLSNASRATTSNSSAILGTLRIYLTTTGALLIAMSLSRVGGITTLSEHVSRPLPPLSVTVLAAPLGVFATYQTIAAAGGDSGTPGSLGQSPADTQVSRLRSEKIDGPWRNICSKLSQARNISSSTIASQSWLNLHRVRRKPTEQKIDGRRTPTVGFSPSMSWPSSLCFCKAFSKLAVADPAEERSSTSVNGNYDPLSFAKSWFLGAKDRDELLLKKKNEREKNSAAAHEATLLDAPAQNVSALSPLALRHTVAPPGPVYLTPPDGVQNIAGVTPSIDGTLSSPGNHAATTAMVDVDVGSNILTEPNGGNWENMVNKRDRTRGSFDSENLFGDLGPDMFGDTDITEADFNFFDEEPGGVDLGPLHLPVIPNPEPTTGPAAGLETLEGPNFRIETADVPMSGGPHSPVFTKPELRHARSSLAEEKPRQTDPQGNPNQYIGVKRPSSPFTPDAVYKKVRASFDNEGAVQRNSLIYGPQRCSIFEKIDFGPGLSAVNSKYEASGRFHYSADRSKGANIPDSNSPPTTDYLKRHGKGRKGLKDPPTNICQLFARVSNAQDSTSNRQSPLELQGTPSDADEVSLVSDEDDSTCESDEPMSPMKSMSTRRRRIDDDGESLATSFKDLECIDATSPIIPLDLPYLSKFEVDLPLTRYFADPEPYHVQFSVSDIAFILAAQILTDQATTTTLSMLAASQSPVQSKVDCRRDLLNITRRSVLELQSILPACVGTATDCQFRPFIEVQDIPFLGQPTRIQPRTPGADQIRPSNLWQIPSPHFALRRYESKLSVLPSAVTFWESLGLGPSQGTKDIHAICVFPDFPGMTDSLLVFTDRMRSVYESLKLGSFNRLTNSNDITDGLVAFDVEKILEPLRESSSFIGPSLLNGFSKLCKALSAVAVQETNFVVYFVFSPDISGSIVESCLAFHQLFEGYKKTLASKRLPIVNDMVLQLIPIDFVSSSTSLANPSPAEFTKLALETYDRCTLFGGPMPSPAIVLEQPPPRHIDFKLTSNPSASLLHENSCLHVAYAQSVDERWVTAAWTDNRGVQQLTTSYCLGRKGKSISTPFADVAREIWETTRRLISAWKVHWRIIIAKCGVMEQHEIDLWASLTQTESKAAMSLTLLTVDTDPSLQLIPPAAKIPTSAASAFYTTPVSTPQPSTVSPEQSALTPGNGSGGGDSNHVTGAATQPNNVAPEPSDADSTLTDVTDHTWGAVLAHRLSINPHAPAADFGQTALISGYLVKRGGARVDDPPVLIEVNVVYVHQYGTGSSTKESPGSTNNSSSGAPSSAHAPAHVQPPAPSPTVHTPPPHLHHPRAYEPLLREVLAHYRALGTLARARGVTDREVDARPWHVAAAEKGVRALYMLM
ncbi:hypothetical protein DL769_009769 [Monosporascus sp. CRB-8-3]|nr:hypothetical protein DL769_009769 [Monosporascus sp. CRB-8-3]